MGSALNTALIASGVCLATVTAGLLVVSAPSREERAEDAARSACKVFREPFDRTNPKVDAMPAEQRVRARRERVAAYEVDAAKAARLDPRWTRLHSAWRDYLAEEQAVAATQTILTECRIALAG